MSVLEKDDRCEAFVKNFHQGICRDQWAQNWSFHMKQQNLSSWLDSKVMKVGIMMKWEDKLQHWPLDFAILKEWWKPSEQAAVTEVKFIVSLWVFVVVWLLFSLQKDWVSCPWLCQMWIFMGIIINFAASQSNALLGFFMFLLPSIFYHLDGPNSICSMNRIPNLLFSWCLKECDVSF